MRTDKCHARIGHVESNQYGPFVADDVANAGGHAAAADTPHQRSQCALDEDGTADLQEIPVGQQHEVALIRAQSHFNLGEPIGVAAVELGPAGHVFARGVIALLDGEHVDVEALSENITTDKIVNNNNNNNFI